MIFSVYRLVMVPCMMHISNRMHVVLYSSPIIDPPILYIKIISFSNSFCYVEIIVDIEKMTITLKFPL